MMTNRRLEELSLLTGRPVCRLDRCGNVLEASGPWETVFAMSSRAGEVLPGSPLLQWVHPDSAALFVAHILPHIRNAKEGQVASWKCRFKAHSRAVTVWLKILPEAESEAVLCLLDGLSEGVFSAEMRQSSLTPQLGGWRFDARTQAVQLNVEAARIFGVEEGKNLTLSQFLGSFQDAHQPLMRFAMNDALNSGMSFDLELCLRLNKEERSWVRMLGQAAAIDEGQSNDREGSRSVSGSAKPRKSIQGYVLNIDRYKSQDFELEKTRAELKGVFLRTEMALNAAQIGTWEWHLKSDQILQDTRSLTLYGQSTQVKREKAGPFSEWLNRISWEDRVRVENTLRSAIRWGTIFETTFHISRANGERRCIRLMGEVLFEDDAPNRLVAAEMDITDIEERNQQLLEAKRRLEKSESHLSLVANTVPMAIVHLDADLYVTFANTTWLHWNGVTHEQAIGEHLSDLVGSSVFLVIQPMILEVLNGFANSFERKRSFGLADTRVIKVQNFPDVSPEGRIRGLISVSTDITDEKSYQARLQQEKREAIEATSAKSRFLATMSHEIRTPLNGIYGICSLLRESSKEPHVLQQLGTVLQSCDTLLTVINDILDFSKLEGGMSPVELNPESLREIFTSAVSLYRPNAEEKGLQLLLDFADSTPDNFILDRVKVTQVVTNLLGNAVKFTHSGSIRVSLSSDQPDSSENADIYWLKMSVRDTGGGISEHGLRSIFEPFRQVDSSRTRRQGGTGLGLSICKQIANLLDGQIHVESHVGQGSLFEFSFPAKLATSLPLVSVPATAVGGHGQTDEEQHAGLSAVPSVIEGARADLQNLRILICEDNQVNQMVMKKMLDSIGLKDYVLAENGKQGLDILRSDPEAFDLVFMDCHMPVMDGFEASRQISTYYNQVLRKDGQFVKPAVVAVTASVMIEDVEACHAAGMDRVLAKPVRKKELEKCLVEVLKKKMEETSVEHEEAS